MFFFLTSHGGGGGLRGIVFTLSVCLSVCMSVCPANILVFYFSAIILPPGSIVLGAVMFLYTGSNISTAV